MYENIVSREFAGQIFGEYSSDMEQSGRYLYMATNENSKMIFESIGHFSTSEQWIHPRRIIGSHEIIIMLKGKVSIEEDNMRYELTKDDILLLEPGKHHGGFQPSQGRTEFIWLHFRTTQELHFKYLRNNTSYEIKTLAKMLLHKSCLPNYAKESLEALTQLIVNELNWTNRLTDKISNRLVVQICEYIRIHIHENVEVRDVARELGYHENYISKVFKDAYGIGLKAYINTQKIDYIKSLLQTTDMPVKLIAGMTGYEDENLMIKFFKYHEGISPSTYRKQYYLTHMNIK